MRRTGQGLTAPKFDSLHPHRSQRLFFNLLPWPTSELLAVVLIRDQYAQPGTLRI